MNKHSNDGATEYNILPLIKDKEDTWQAEYKLTDNNLTAAKRSYDRTMDILGEGLKQCQDYLAQQKEAREQYYYDLAHNPEKFETVEEVIPETTAAVEETTLPNAA